MSQKRTRSINWDEEEKTTEDKALVTPMLHRGTTHAKQVAKRKMNLNNIINRDKNSRKDHEGYINSMISHSKMLKDEEHMRRMEMAEEEHAMKMEIHRKVREEHAMKMEIHRKVKEEHAIKMEIHRESLKSAILQKEILELQKERDLLLNKQ